MTNKILIELELESYEALMLGIYINTTAKGEFDFHEWVTDSGHDKLMLIGQCILDQVAQKTKRTGINLNFENEVKPTILDKNHLKDLMLKTDLKIDIRELGLSFRASNALWNNDVLDLWKLMNTTIYELKTYRNIGKSTLKEIILMAEKHGIKLKKR